MGEAMWIPPLTPLIKHRPVRLSDDGYGGNSLNYEKLNLRALRICFHRSFIG
jgi:hypothetical protein